MSTNKKPTATTTDLSRRMGAPSWDEPIEKWITWIFDWSIEKATANYQRALEILAKVDLDERWCPWTLADSLADECKLLGLPCDPKRHEQPYDLRRLFTPPLSGSSLRGYMSDPDDPQRPLECLTPELWICWKAAILEIGMRLEAAGIPHAERMRHAIPEIWLIGFRLLLFTWPESAGARLQAFTRQCDYLKYTSGLFDPISGHLTNPDLAAEREFLATKGKP